MRSKYILIVLSVVAAMAAVAVVVLAGDPDNPPGPPETTNSYTLENIYNRLDSGAAGTQSAFTEPSSGPPTGTMHALNEIMAVAPQVDDTNGATAAQVVFGRTYWSLQSGAWGLRTGTMPDNGAVTIVPTTTQQTIGMGYHDGSGTVEGDADLTAGNIKGGVSVFGVDGTLYAPVPRTGQTRSYGPGDNGDLETGVEWPSPRFTDNGNGTVTDNLTGLIWLQKASCFGQRDWATALSDTNDLASGSCGLTDGSSTGDWRLPNVRELQSLINYGRCYPALPSGHPFTGVQLFDYWSSTSYANVTSYAWFVYLYYGFVNAYDKSHAIYVWPVRGGQ
jgi:hypothetical protein